LDALPRYFFYEFSGPIATIIESQEKRLYFCFYNTKQNILDFHQTSSDEAFAKVQALIVDKYNNFESECTIITGRGNHVNSNGATGVLYKAFKQWAKKELTPYIKSYIPIRDNGGYKVILREPITLILSSQTFQTNLEQVITSIIKADQAGNRRLIITHQQPQSSIYFYTLQSQAFIKLAQQHSFSVVSQPKNVENGIHITWKKD
jgi:hypothetical protein